MKLPKFSFFSYFFLLGLISVVGQAMILREITSLFYGNEIFYGLGLGRIGELLSLRLEN